MAFCSFDDSAALFDSTPVENMFITEYMLRAPGDFVKVYLYALMLCYHPTPRMSLSSMARDLDMTEEDVERAFKYWARDGLVRQVGDNPVSFTLFNLKQLTLTRAENPGDKLYNQKFIEEAERILKRTLQPEEINLINDWIQVLELPEEVVLMLLQIEMENSRGRVSISIAGRRAKEWAQSGIRTVDDVEKIVVMGREREQQLRKLLARLGQRRTPSEDEKAMYKTWIDEWGFTPEAVQEACRETTKGTPTMAYLNGILMRQHQLGRHEVIALETGMQTEHEARNFAREVYAGLGVTGKTPTQDDLAAIETWHEQGANDELILLAVKAAHGKSGGGNMDDVDNYLQDWCRRGLTTPEAVRAESARTRMLNGQLRERAGPRSALPLGGRNGHDAGIDCAGGGIRARRGFADDAHWPHSARLEPRWHFDAGSCAAGTRESYSGNCAKSAGFADGSKAGRYAALYAGRTPRNIQRCRREF